MVVRRVERKRAAVRARLRATALRAVCKIERRRLKRPEFLSFFVCAFNPRLHPFYSSAKPVYCFNCSVEDVSAGRAVVENGVKRLKFFSLCLTHFQTTKAKAAPPKQKPPQQPRPPRKTRTEPPRANGPLPTEPGFRLGSFPHHLAHDVFGVLIALLDVARLAHAA